MASSWRAVMSALGAVVLALCVLAGPYAMGVAVLLLCGVFAWGWPVLMGTPSPRGSTVTITVVAVACVVVVIAMESPAYLSIVMAFGVIGAFLQQLARTDGRENIVGAVSATVTGVVVVTSASGWVLAIMDFAGEETVITGLAVLVLASAVTAFPFRSAYGAAAAAVLGAGGGLAIGAIFPHLSLVTGAIVGLVVGGMMALSHLVLGTFPATSRWSAALGAALLPMLVLGIPIHLVAALAA